MKKKIETFFQSLIKRKSRAEALEEVGEEMAKTITQTILEEEVFTSSEKAIIVEHIKTKVNLYLLNRQEVLRERLQDCDKALQILN